jgi:hypothetical protein
MMHDTELNIDNIGYFELWIVPEKWGQIKATKGVYRQRFSHYTSTPRSWKSACLRMFGRFDWIKI